MKWAEVLEDPSLNDLPYKIELNEWGQIVMSPANAFHSRFQGRIGSLLERHLGETVAPEIPVQTAKNVKVPDVVWMSKRFLRKHGKHALLPCAPEICVEVRSPSNSDGDIDEKRDLYLAAGALEVWICDVDGTMIFFDRAGRLPKSKLAPAFPKLIKL